VNGAVDGDGLQLGRRGIESVGGHLLAVKQFKSSTNQGKVTEIGTCHHRNKITNIKRLQMT
jgi:hypothetical protein